MPAKKSGRPTTLLEYGDDESFDTPSVRTTPYQTDITIDQLPIPKVVVDRWRPHFTHLYPNQVEAASSLFQIPILRSVVESKHLIAKDVAPDRVILQSQRSLLITTATSSGKTMIAHMFMMKYLGDAASNLLAVYVVPLKAVGSEKYREFTDLYDGRYTVGIIMGDEQQFSDKEKRYNILITTYEKFDQLLQTQKDDIIPRLVCAVFDEIHWVGTEDRGMPIERCIAKVQTANTPVMGLSATIQNNAEIARWLKAGLIVSSFRPVPLEKGIMMGTTLKFYNHHGDVTSERSLPIVHGLQGVEYLLMDRYTAHDSVLYFRQSKKGVKSTAEKLLKVVQKSGKCRPSGLKLPSISTDLDKTLQQCIEYRIGFHHASLSSENRAYIEQMFNQRKIHLLIATPTLAAGVNTPAKWVIADYMAFRNNGMAPLPVSEMHQMFGRAGRPMYDTEGFAVLNGGDTPKPDVEQMLIATYLSDTVDVVVSQFKADTLYMSCLGMIAGGYASTVKQLHTIHTNTLAYVQSKDFRTNLGGNLCNVMHNLATRDPNTVAMKESTYSATLFGKIINQLYIHPTLATDIVTFLRTVPKGKAHPIPLLYFLFTHADLMTIPAHKTDTLWLTRSVELLRKHRIMILDDEPDLSALKTVLMLIGNGYASTIWADTKITEDHFYHEYDMNKGDMERLIGANGKFKWLIYGLHRISAYIGRPDIVDLLTTTEIRITKAVSEDAVPLCRITQVGKERAKALLANGYRTPADIISANIETLKQVVVNEKPMGDIAETIWNNAVQLEKKRSTK